ncbi:MAG: hypothetical protein MI861_10735, partial [Pirellulales bacterium]|nr:hypothetical protein [Pirellulales bacterium]
LLIFLGIANILWAIIYLGGALLLLGLVSLIPALEEELPDGDAELMFIAIGGLLALGVLSVATTVACFVGKPPFWYIMLFSYGYGFADRVFGVVGRVMDGEAPRRIGGAVFGVVLGLSFWAFIHSDEVKAYYGTTKSSLVGLVIADVLGFGIGCAVAAAVVFMV